MISSTAAEIVLAGPPGNVVGVVPVDVERSIVMPMTISVSGESSLHRAVMRPSGRGSTQIRLRLPPDTPPGSYSAEATVDGKPRRVRVDVESVLRIRVQPRLTTLTAAAASNAPFDLTVSNNGNVPLEIPETDVFDLDDPVVQDRALGRTLRATLEKGERRVDRLFEELREGHAGEGRVRVRSGAGPLLPGETRTLSCVLDLPPNAQAGRSYLGPWKLGNAAHLIRADIATKGPNGAKAAKTRATNGRAKR